VTRFLSWYYLLLLLPVFYLFLMKKGKKNIKFSSLKIVKNSGIKKTKKHLTGKILIFIGVVLSIIALARPQSGNKKVNSPHGS